MSTGPVKVLIAGAGIAGPALAYWLTRVPTKSALSITIVERSPTPRITGQSIDIRGPAVQIMRDMDLEGAVRACGTPEKGLHKLNSTGQILMTLDSTGDTSRQGFTSEFEILRGDLARVLCESVESRPGVEFVYGDYISSIMQDGNGGKARVEFTNGKIPAGDYDLVVGADGVMSRMRPLITGRPAKEDIRGLNAYGALFTVPRAEYDSGTYATMFHFPGSRWIMTRPSSAGTGVYMSVGPGPKNEALERALEMDPQAQRAEMERAFADRPGTGRAATARLLNGMHTAPDFYFQNIVQVHAPRWTAGRLAVVGDAACCPSAFSGMGTSGSLYGAYVLAGELIGALGDGGDGNIVTALERYESKARPYLLELQDISPTLWRLFCPTSVWGVWILDAVFWIFGLLRPLEIFMWIASKFPQSAEIMTIPEYRWAPA